MLYPSHVACKWATGLKPLSPDSKANAPSLTSELTPWEVAPAEGRLRVLLQPAGGASQALEDRAWRRAHGVVCTACKRLRLCRKS